MVCMCADCAHIYPRPVKSEAGCPTHSCLWNEWESISAGGPPEELTYQTRGCPTHSRLWNEWESISLTTIRLVRIDGQSPTHSKTANVWGTQSWGPVEMGPVATTLVLYTDPTSVTYVTAYAVVHIVHFSLVGKIPTLRLRSGQAPSRR